MVAISLAVGLTILICAGRPKKLSVLPEMAFWSRAKIISPQAGFGAGHRAVLRTEGEAAFRKIGNI